MDYCGFNFDYFRAERDMFIDEIVKNHPGDYGSKAWLRHEKAINDYEIELYKKYLDEANIGHTSQTALMIARELGIR